MSTLKEKQKAILRKAAAAIKDRDHEGDAQLADSVLGIIQSFAATQAPSAPTILTPSLEYFLARTMPPKGYEGCSVIERNAQLIWLRKEDRLPTDLICFFDGDCRDVLTPYDSRVQPPIKLAPSAPVAPDERAAFEAWVVTDEGGWMAAALKRNVEVRDHENFGDYSDDDVHSQWEAWQARAALSVKAEPTIQPSLLREPISASNPLPPGCFCKPGRCGAPVIMGRQTPCRDPAKRDAAPTPPLPGEG